MHERGIIAAIASPAGAGARIVLRISGAGCWAIIGQLVPTELPRCGRVVLTVDRMQFPAMLLRFEQGYTGEESAELHLPGNVLLARMVLERLYDLCARPAEPGEFTARAFFNGRLDLAEAEGVAATINATNERELAAARKLQSGELARRLAPITDELTQTLALVEAGIDFSEEDIRFVSAGDLARRVQDLIDRLHVLLADSARFERLAHEPTIVLCGRPNAGKSTLLNTLAGRTRAVVSPTAGTTRDLLEAEVRLDRGVVRVIDTAGLEERGTREEAKGKREKAIDTAMQERALLAIESADVVVLIHDQTDELPPPALPRASDLVIRTKSDLPSSVFVLPSSLPVSSLTGEGLAALRSRLAELAFGARGGESLALNARHVHQLELACSELALLLHEAQAGAKTEELLAERLRYALDALGEITGMVSPDEVLGRVFATFCIGK